MECLMTSAHKIARSGLAALVVCLGLAASAASAQEPARPSDAAPMPMPTAPTDQSQSAPGGKSIGEILTKQAGCTEYTDACVICKETPDHKVACSTPGIACVKGEWKCTVFRFGASTQF